MNEVGYLLDASAVLAMLGREPGGDVVAHVLMAAAVSTVNWSEIRQNGHDHGIDMDETQADLESLGVTFAPFGLDEAAVAAELWHRGAHRLSFADRACLATAKVHGVPTLTADRAWASLDMGVNVRLIRD